MTLADLHGKAALFMQGKRGYETGEIVRPGEKEREVYLPSDGWIHLWSGKEYEAGTAAVDAPMGFPPVFYRRGCAHEALFRSLAEKFN